jgi:hypothetical protein
LAKTGSTLAGPTPRLGGRARTTGGDQSEEVKPMDKKKRERYDHLKKDSRKDGRDK